MADVFDIAAYILNKVGNTSAIKLQKLVYYSQAWSLVWDDPPHAPLFPEQIEAWAMGPVVPSLYEEHRGKYIVNEISKGNLDALTKDQRETVDAVLNLYGKKSPSWLSSLTHQEPPWKDARARAAAPPGSFCDEEITHVSMAEYYSSLIPA